MSRIVVIEKDQNGNIKLTKEELQKMLDDAYSQGYSDGKGVYDFITYPSRPWYYATSLTGSSSNKITLDASDINTNKGDI